MKGRMSANQIGSSTQRGRNDEECQRRKTDKTKTKEGPSDIKNLERISDCSKMFFSVSQFPFEVGLLIATTLSTLVCLSRLYTGMHSVLVSRQRQSQHTDRHGYTNRDTQTPTHTN